MKITRKQLNQIIKEEKQKLLRESDLEGLRDSLDSVNQLSFVLHDLSKGNAKEEDVLYYTSRAVDDVLRMIYDHVYSRTELSDEQLQSEFSGAFQKFLSDLNPEPGQ